MDRTYLILGVHLLVALGMVGIGVYQLSVVGNPVSATVRFVAGAAIALLGLFIARRQ